MLRSTASKVMWVGRATVFLVGLAVILALVFGAVSTVSAHTGEKGFFHLGHKNVAKTVSTLVKKGVGPALSLKVGSGPPLAVNSGVKVANLNSDRLDNLDSSAFLKRGQKAADSDKLDGLHESAFLRKTGTAADSDKLDGNDSTAFVRRSGTLSIPGVTFQPRTSSTTTGACWPESVTWKGAGENAFYAPVNLPSGVTVTKVIFHWWDSSSSSNATAELRRLNVPTTANPTTMATVSSNSASPAHQSSQTTAITNATIDNTNAQYYVRATLGSEAGVLCIDGVQIEYAG